MKKIIVVGLSDELYDPFMRIFDNLEFLFFDFFEVETALAQAVALKCYVTLRFKTRPPNYESMMSWLQYLEDNKVPIEKVFIIHQATAYPNWIHELQKLHDVRGYGVFDIKSQELVDYFHTL